MGGISKFIQGELDGLKKERKYPECVSVAFVKVERENKKRRKGT